MSGHVLVRQTNVGEPLYGMPKWQYGERGEPRGSYPTPSPSATRTCSCGTMVVGPSDSAASLAFDRHKRAPAEGERAKLRRAADAD